MTPQNKESIPEWEFSFYKEFPVIKVKDENKNYSNVIVADPDKLKSFIRNNFIPKEELKKALLEEISIAHTKNAGGKTSRLTSLYNRFIL